MDGKYPAKVSDPKGWPRDPRGYQFVFRALPALASRMFGAENLLSEWPPRHPAKLSAQTSDPEQTRTMAVMLGYLDRPDLGEDIIADPDAAFQREVANIRRRYSQAEDVTQELLRLLEAGEAQAWSMREDDGKIQDVPAEEWRTKRAADYLRHGQYQRSYGYAGSFWEWLILRQGEFSKPPAAVPTQAGGRDLSVYLRLMLGTIERMDINPDDDPPKNREAILADLQAHWPEGVPWSDRLWKAMGTLVRSPDAQAGRARGKKAAE